MMEKFDTDEEYDRFYERKSLRKILDNYFGEENVEVERGDETRRES